MSSYKKEFSNKTAVVLGFGVEGISSTRFLLENGAKVTVADKKRETDFDKETVIDLGDKGVTFYFGSFPDLYQYDLIVRSPGVSLKIPELQDISRDKITSATKLFFDLCPCPIIGVTGTKGKGTTATLMYEMLKADVSADSAQVDNVYLGGNIGTPALDFLDQLNEKSIVVLELSSFQLIDLHKSPHIAVMLMVTSEHLDYHKDIAEYVEAKRNILRHQTASDFAVLNKDYPASNESDIETNGKLFFVSRENEVESGCFVKEGKVVVKQNGEESDVLGTKDIMLPGKHNLENVCAAVMAATLAGVNKKQIVSVLKSFKGLDHRLELVRTVRGVKYYDDSFSTTPETAEAAIEAFEDPKILILGGSSKNSDFTRLGQVIGESENIKAIIGIGEEWRRMKVQFPVSNFHFPIIEDCKTMEDVVQKASEVSEPGDVVLLSPACASFDMFTDYKDRGNQFKNSVKDL